MTSYIQAVANACGREMARTEDIKLRKHLNADTLFNTISTCFAGVRDFCSDTDTHSPADSGMPGSTMFSFKDSSLFFFDERRCRGPHNLMTTIYGEGSIPYDTSMREILDGVGPTGYFSSDSRHFLSKLSQDHSRLQFIDNITRIKEEPVDEKFSRDTSIYCCRKFSGAKLKVIGEHFGISDAAFSQANRRLALKAEKDQVLKKLIRRLEGETGEYRKLRPDPFGSFFLRRKRRLYYSF